MAITKIKSLEYLKKLTFYSEYVDFKRAKFVHMETRFEKPDNRNDGTASKAAGRINFMSYKNK